MASKLLQRKRGRPRLFAEELSVSLTEEQLSYIKAEAQRTCRSYSQVTRELIMAGIEASDSRAARKGAR